MGNLSQNFNRSEFECKCGCGFNTADVSLIKVLEAVRANFGMPITINSACRCKARNDNEGGVVNSKHLLGIAADIVVKDVSADDVYNYLNDNFPDSLGLGSYESFTHIDVRKDWARW